MLPKLTNDICLKISNFVYEPKYKLLDWIDVNKLKWVNISANMNAIDYLKENGMLTTYCAQGQFKRNLKTLGMKVQSVNGPVGKREMTTAYKESQLLEHLL
jgi:hypothetical protein